LIAGLGGEALPGEDAAWSLMAGYGVSVHVTRGRTDEQLLAVLPQYSIRLGEHFDYLVEGHLAKYFSPNGYAAGLVPLSARYVFSRSNAAVYLGLGAGFCWTDLKVEEINRRFNFILEGGPGIRWNVSGGRAWTIDLRWLHYSNAGTVLPNLGLNSVVALGGWTF
jgi:lipid A 3-O-deacylase PagL